MLCSSPSGMFSVQILCWIRIGGRCFLCEMLIQLVLFVGCSKLLKQECSGIGCNGLLYSSDDLPGWHVCLPVLISYGPIQFFVSATVAL
ncbi:hypothetical protein Nepgr_002819 [Nepenthes gracilis]|uniref:Uncharacterized protein n=1 Tax=Nepenthes gracilis TaxID=150966 RepID=A0AAD3RYK9_NEPGR|nr:hypothetical protein Nepgr_002819 [Nepenthes gracilis]